jgi:type I restriction enzyme S subunit
MKFSDVLDIRNGRNQRQVENENGKYPIYGSGGIMGRATDFICDAGTVVIGRKGSINNPIFVDEPFWNVDTAFGLVAHRDVLLPKYLFYFCVNFDFERLNTTVTIPSLTKANLLQIEINVPDMDEQRRVVSILDKICQLIDLQQQELHSLDQLVKSRFIELFGDPETNPKGWTRQRLDQICENLDSRRVPITSTNRKAGNYPYYGASGIVDYVKDYIFDEDILLISEDGANLVMRSTPIAFSVSGKVWVNNHAHVVRFESKATQKYIEICFALTDISGSITGTAQPKLNQAKLNAMMFCVPPIELQEQFATFVEQTDKSKLCGKMEVAA